MKNKHLVLIFILTLAIGLSVRRAPWKFTDIFQAELITMDTGAIRQIEVLQPQSPPVTYLRGDAGWQAEGDERSVLIPAAASQAMLAILKDMRSIRIVKTEQADTLGLGPDQAIRLSLEDENQRKETLIIGKSVQTGQGSACYLQLPRHLGIYLVDKDLRPVFSKKTNDFRPKNILDFPADSLKAFTIARRLSDTLNYEKNDSSGLWQNPASGRSISAEQWQQWRFALGQLRDLPFADAFDESHARENLYAEINMEFADRVSSPLKLEIYRFSVLNLPEERAGKAFAAHPLPAFVLRSSQNPTNYFSVEDSFLIHQICRTW